jgi:arylsulfatase A-like enzyme
MVSRASTAPETSEESNAARVAVGALALVVSSAIAGLLGGMLVFLVEALDRLATLWQSFNTPGEAIVFALYLAPVVMLGVVAGIVAGPALALLGWIVDRLRRLVEPRAGRYATLAARVAFAIAVTGIALVALESIAFAFGERSLRRIAMTISLYLMDADASVLSRIAQAASAWVVPILLVLVCAASLVLAAVPAAIRFESEQERAAGRYVRAIVAASIVVVLYVFDSRYEYGRYDAFLHVPAAILQCCFAFLAVAFVARPIGRPIGNGTLARCALAILAFVFVATTFAFVHIGANENVKALLWRRSVVARRVYSVAVRMFDRDGDGYSSLLAGGDTDDSNPAVHPLADEIAGNGVDDNCIGGDLGAVVSPPAPVASARTLKGKRFVLIAIDTLRADRMGLYGYGRSTTPRIDEHAKAGLVYDSCFSQGTNTAVAFSAMQTSASRGSVFEADRDRLFVRLSKAGFATAQINAVEEGIWLRAKSTSGPYRRVILDGIQTFPHEFGDEFWDADRVTDSAIEYLATLPADRPSATWVHYFDPHTPRRKMAPFDFGDSASDKYDSEVAFADREVGRLLDWLRTSGFADDAIVILTADHGEAFLEHGMDFHGNRPYSEQIHIPLVVWASGLEPGRSATPASIIDIAPTVLEYLQLPPMPKAEGTSLFASSPPDRPIFSETPLNIVDGPFFAFSVTQSRWRLIYDVIGNTTELYDLENDSREMHNLADSRPDRVMALRTLLGHWMDTTRSVATVRDAHELLGDD